MKKIALGLSMLLSQTGIQTTEAALKAPDFSVVAQRQESSWIITAIAPGAHHFNIDAPMSLNFSKELSSLVRPQKAEVSKVVFLVPKTTDVETFEVTLYLCDDAKTFCEKHAVDFSTTGKEKKIAAATPVSGEPRLAKSASSKAKSEHGFLVNLPDEAFAQAKLENKPVIIDFFGVWCPPCNELDEKVFSSKEFSKAASRFIRLKLDADAPVSWILKSKYQIGGYPTVIFASSDGDEISRIVGYRPKADFVSTLSQAWENRTTALTQLEALALKGDRDAADRAGIIRLERGEGEAAAHLLSGTQKKKESLYRAEILNQDDKDASVAIKIKTLTKAISEFPKTPNTVDWLEKLSKIQMAQNDEKASKASLQQAIDLSRELAKNPKLLEGYDSTAADVLENEASLREELDGKVIARADWLKAATAYYERGVGPKERANNLEMAYCLGKGGELDEARKIYKRLQEFYPDEFTFYFAQARMEYDAKNFDTASALAQKAQEFAYGDNRLRVTLLLAQSLASNGKKAESRKVIDETIQAIALPSDSKIRTHRYAQALIQFRKTL